MKKLLKERIFKFTTSPQNPLSLLARVELQNKALKKNAEYVIKQGIGQHFSELNLKNYKKSETVFILGSGSSINQLRDHQWDIIASSDSIGFNFWLIHDFIPSLFFFELPRDLDRRMILSKLLNKKSRDYQETPIVVKKVFGHEKEGLLDFIPQKIYSNIFFARTVDLVSRNEPQHLLLLQKRLKALQKLRYITKDSSQIRILFQQRASLSYLIIFAYMMGYNNIVLCGIDLNNTNYFFSERETYYQHKGIPTPNNVQQDQVHKTMHATLNPLTVDRVIYSINQCLLIPNNCHLYIGSKESALYPELPFYFS
jgi:hypothetical protein